MGKRSHDRRDAYYLKAKREGLRARSAYKLVQIVESLSGVLPAERDGPRHVVVDLCAAPGGWCNVLAQRYHSRVIAVDLQPMAPEAHVDSIVGDLTAESTVERLQAMIPPQGCAAVVMDGAPDVMLRPSLDAYVQHQLVIGSVELAVRVLREGGSVTCKLFRAPGQERCLSLLQKHFRRVIVTKPKACRASSVEGFVVGLGFIARANDGKSAQHALPTTNGTGTGASQQADSQAGVHDSQGATHVEFMMVGEEDALDSDRGYPLDDDHAVVAPVAPPTEPAYKDSIAARRGQRAGRQ